MDTEPLKLTQQFPQDRPSLPQKDEGEPHHNYLPQTVHISPLSSGSLLSLKNTAEIKAMAEHIAAATGRDAHIVEHEIRNILYARPHLTAEEVQRALDALHTPLTPPVTPEPNPTRLYWLQHNHGQPIRRPSNVPGRNDPCPCGSGKKFKKCCLQRSGAQ